MLWQCRLCGSQNERTDAPCGVCGKGVYPADAVVAGAAGVAEPMGRRGVGAVITPGAAPAGPGGPAGPLPPPAPTGPARPVTTPVPARRRTGRRVFFVILVLLVLIAIAVVIAITATSTDSYGASGALAAPMVFLPAARWPGGVHPPVEPPAGRPAPRERGGIRAS